MNFSDFNLHPSLLRGIADLGFTEPTQIQRDGIPPALEGRDVLGCAMTGSGKTAAFLLPTLDFLMENHGKGPRKTRVLVLAPTRELAAQIVEQCDALARHTPLRAAAVYGGVGMGPQEKALRQGVEVVAACPGRLLDHMSRPYGKLDGIEVLVLDEVDRMLDMGFLPDIRRILKQLPKPEQTLLFSATLPREIAKLAHELLNDPVTIDVERPSAPAEGVRQAIYPVRQDLKSALLLELLRRDEISNALVFTRTKHRANRLAQYLDKNGVSCDRIHGNRSQAQRTRALDGFRDGKHRVLVATDVAARGIDVEALSHVINFDVPNVPEDYIHRVGRTARAGNTGDAFTFVAPQEMSDLRTIERKVGKSLSRRLLEEFDYDTPSKERLEIPLADRLAAHRAKKSADRARSKAKNGQHGHHGQSSGEAKKAQPGRRRRRRRAAAGRAS